MTKTLLDIEGFDYLTSLTNNRFLAVASASIVTGRNGGSGLQLTGTSGSCNFGFNIVALGDRVICGFAIKVTTVNISGQYLTLLDNAGNSHAFIGISATGFMNVGMGSVLGTGTTLLTNNVWYYFEFEALLSNTVGELYARLNGVDEITVTGVDTLGSGTGILSAASFNTGTSRTAIFDDIYIRTASAGDTAKTSFYGDVRVSGLLPTGAGTTTQWTPSTGSNFQNVDDTDPDSDSTYNSTSTLNQIDTFATADLPSTGTVYGVQSLIAARKTDAGPATIASVYRIGGVNYVGADRQPSIDYSFVMEIKETSPATSSPWTTTEINNAEVGYKKTA